MDHNRRVTEKPQGPNDRRPRFWNRVYELTLKSRWSRLFFLVVIAVLGLILTLQTARIVLAQNLSDSFNPHSIRQAMTIDPANPDPHFELGKILLLTGDPAQQVTAEHEFRAAVQMNSDSAAYWSGLATACYSTGDQACADAAFTRARQLAPSNPQFAWQAAVNDVVSNQPQAAVQELRTFLRLQPDGLTQTFQLLTRGFDRPEMVWRDLLGSSSNLHAQVKFLEFLAAANRVEAANAFWQDLASQRKAVSIPEATPYIDQLLAGGHYAEAANVWASVRSGPSTDYTRVLDEPNLVFNGSFEQQPLNAGFDWRYAKQPYVDLSFSDPAAKAGRQALSVDFSVPQNSEYDVIYQFVPVAPNQTYELSAFFKAQGLTSDSGPRLRIMDPRCQACLDASTEGVTGTSDWRRIGTRFSTGPTTDMVRLSLWRPRSRAYPTEISGELWLDDVSLVKVDSTPGQP